MGFQFDPNIPSFISGDFTQVAVVEPGGLGASNLVLDPTKTYNINVAWEITGSLTPLWLAALKRDVAELVRSWRTPSRSAPARSCC